MIDFKKFFPYPTIRDQQEKTLQEIASHWYDKKYFILELGTGIGKSAIAKCIASFSASAYIVTETKQLMDQYIKDFSGSRDLVDIKGRNNYECVKYPNFDCSNAPCMSMTSKSAARMNCMSSCKYIQQRQAAINAHTALTSYSFLFKIANSLKRTQSSDSRSWQRRQTIIFDEAHSLEDQIVTMAQFALSPEKLNERHALFDNCSSEERKHLLSKFSVAGFDANAAKINRIDSLIMQKLHEYESDIESFSDNLNDEVAEENVKELVKKKHGLSDLKKKLDAFASTYKDDSSWIVQPDIEGDLVFTPLEINDLFKLYCDAWADKFVFMSASLLDTEGYIKMLGIERDKCLVIKKDSPFDPAKSPIYFMPCGKMTYSDIANSMPKVIQVVDKVLDSKKDQKGIIHTGTYKIAKEIYDSIQSPRFLMRSSDKVSNQNLLDVHSRSKNSVLLSPSMTTGVDLKDDLSRWLSRCHLHLYQMNE